MNDYSEQPHRDNERAEDRHQKEREVLFANEAFVIKVLQVVPGGALVGALSQADTLIDLAGIGSYLIFLSAMALALVAAVLAAHWKHQYKMWDVKALATRDDTKKPGWHARSRRYLKAMRAGIWTALLLVVVAFIQLVACLWIVALGDPSSSPDTQAAVHVGISDVRPFRL